MGRHEQKFENDLAELVALIADLREQEALGLVKALIEAGASPADILDHCQMGMRQVGEKYSAGEYFIAGLILAGEIMRETLDLLRPVIINQQPSGKKLGRVLLGTIAGDIHDIGKNILKDLLECHGFAVLDLGVDVPPEVFLRKAEEFKPDLIGVSVLITDSYPHLCELVELFANSGARTPDRPLILVGGGQVDHQVFTISGADFWESDALSAVQLCKRLMAGREKTET